MAKVTLRTTKSETDFERPLYDFDQDALREFVDCKELKK